MSSPNGLFSGSHAHLRWALEDSVGWIGGLWKTALGGSVGFGGRWREIGGLWKTAAGEFRQSFGGLPSGGSFGRALEDNVTGGALAVSE